MHFCNSTRDVEVTGEIRASSLNMGCPWSRRRYLVNPIKPELRQLDFLSSGYSDRILSFEYPDIGGS